MIPRKRRVRKLRHLIQDSRGWQILPPAHTPKRPTIITQRNRTKKRGIKIQTKLVQAVAELMSFADEIALGYDSCHANYENYELSLIGDSNQDNLPTPGAVFQGTWHEEHRRWWWLCTLIISQSECPKDKPFLLMHSSHARNFYTLVV